MQSQNRLFDDLARVAGGALGTLSGIRNELEALMRQQFERILTEMNLVTREEFDAVQAMAAKARTEQESLAARVAVLEAALSARRPAAPAAPAAAAAAEPKPRRRRPSAPKTAKGAAKPPKPKA